MVVGRLAPTPSGELHLGNALAFGAAWLSVRNAGGRLLLRIEDVDRGRARESVAEGQRRDLGWLGLDWDEEVPAQSTRTYSLAGIPTYRCPCTRQSRLYLGCRCRTKEHDRGAWRFLTPGGAVSFTDRACGKQLFAEELDPILMRADGEPAYPLAVVVDDGRDGVTEVVRGADLLEATATQIRLQRVLGLRQPTYLHVPVLLGPDGKKLAKSHGSTSISALRATGWAAADVWAQLLPVLGIQGDSLGEALLTPSAILRGPCSVGADGRVRPAGSESPG